MVTQSKRTCHPNQLLAIQKATINKHGN